MNLLLASTVLVIGDSHSVGPFGWFLDENLRKAGYQVATYGSCGSIAKWWSTSQKTTCGYYAHDLAGTVTQVSSHATPLLSELLSSVRPEAVIVELGTNYVATPSDEFVVDDLKAMVKMIKDSGASCLWVSPPDMRKFRLSIPRLDKLIREAVAADCKIFDSQTVTTYPETGGDGVHYWFAAAKPIAQKWADAVFGAFKE